MPPKIALFGRIAFSWENSNHGKSEKALTNCYGLVLYMCTSCSESMDHLLLHCEVATGKGYMR